MSYQYVTKENVKLWVIPEADLTDADTAARIDALINAASGMVDKYCRRPEGYFSPAAAEPTTRRVRGEGKRYLRLGRYTGTPTFSSPTISVNSYYFNSENGWVYYNDLPPNDEFLPGSLGDNFFADGSIYIVSARWGFEATPDDIQMATALIAGKIWDVGKGVIGEISPSGFVIERDMPPVAKTMLTGWIRREFEIN
jgi:hypothetical protein